MSLLRRGVNVAGLEMPEREERPDREDGEHFWAY